MSKKEKLILRLRSHPSDFTFEELVRLLGYFGYGLINAGKTGGSRVIFADENKNYIRIHKPHPRNVLKPYQIDDVIAALRQRGLL
jgi:hypothetical protein